LLLSVFSLLCTVLWFFFHSMEPKNLLFKIIRLFLSSSLVVQLNSVNKIIF
jgi:hypothetical protein